MAEAVISITKDRGPEQVDREDGELQRWEP